LFAKFRPGGESWRIVEGRAWRVLLRGEHALLVSSDAGERSTGRRKPTDLSGAREDVRKDEPRARRVGVQVTASGYVPRTPKTGPLRKRHLRCFAFSVAVVPPTAWTLPPIFSSGRSSFRARSRRWCPAGSRRYKYVCADPNGRRLAGATWRIHEDFFSPDHFETSPML
jgi:hypothetical protein